MSHSADFHRLVELLKRVEVDPHTVRNILQTLPIEELRAMSDQIYRLHQMIEDQLV